MKIPLLDLKTQYAQLRDEIRPAIDEICESQNFILGEPVVQLEAEISSYCAASHACGVSSGSDALLISLMAEQIGPGDEVITTPYTFFATAGAISRVGAKPVFVDIDPLTFNLDADKIEEKINPRTKAIIVVHLFGHAADLDPIIALAKAYNLIVIEDAAQAIGAEYKGRRVGGLGDYGCLSFFPSKNLGCFGDGGMVLTNDEEKLDRLRSLRNHGASIKYYHDCIGGNFRLDGFQAKVLSVKLKYLDQWTASRQKNAEDYRTLLNKSGGPENVRLPRCADYCTRHIYNQFCIRVLRGQRDAVLNSLRFADIGCQIYYPLPLHLQKCYADLGYIEGDYPNSELAARETLVIPIYPELTDEQKQFVVKQLHDTVDTLFPAA